MRSSTISGGKLGSATNDGEHAFRTGGMIGTAVVNRYDQADASD
jgi:hypothetical protein